MTENALTMGKDLFLNRLFPGTGKVTSIATSQEKVIEFANVKRERTAEDILLINNPQFIPVTDAICSSDCRIQAFPASSYLVNQNAKSSFGAPLFWQLTNWNLMVERYIKSNDIKHEEFRRINSKMNGNPHVK